MSEYQDIYRHYEGCLEKYGDTAKGLDWPNVEGMITRYKVMADLVKGNHPRSLLDIGCGTGAFYSYLQTHRPEVYYTGLDISEKFVDLCKKKYPNVGFICGDLLDTSQNLYLIDATGHNYDYAVMNGIFTAKYKLTQEQMFDFLTKMLTRVLKIVKKGVAFNVMSEHVDWKRDDLFHLPHDQLANFITKELGTRNFVFRNDYGLYEYTTYIYQ